MTSAARHDIVGTRLDVEQSRLGHDAAARVEQRRSERCSRPNSAVTRVVLVGILVAGFLFRLWGLGARRLNFDESFTAMAGRRPLGDLVHYLAHNDSHPPLDFVLRAPLARAGVGELVFRLPSVLFSCAALVLFAWWMRRRGLAGMVAVALMAVAAFQVAHGREARMYAEMELVGVAAAIVLEAWLRRPRSWHATAIGALTFVGSMTHVSMLLLATGLFAAAGGRRDREAWRWRVSISAGVAAWALLWGPWFAVQTRGGHSDWVPPTSFPSLEDALARLVTYNSLAYVPVLLAVGAGTLVLARHDRVLARAWACSFLVPVAVAAVAGLVAPVMLDRTFTVVAWAPLVALGFLVAELTRRSRAAGLVTVIVLAAVTIPSVVASYALRTGPDRALRVLEQRARPGDVVAVQGVLKIVELQWSIGVREGLATRPVAVHELPDTAALVLGHAVPTGRVWLLDEHGSRVNAFAQCASAWRSGAARVLCIRRPPPASQRALSSTRTP